MVSSLEMGLRSLFFGTFLECLPAGFDIRLGSLLFPELFLPDLSEVRLQNNKL